MASEAEKKAQKKYAQKNIKSVVINLNINYDKDILQKLSMVDNKAGYIKQLIRDDIKRN